MRHLIDLCSTTLLHRLPLAPTASATLEAESRHLPPRQCSAATTRCTESAWAALAAAANRWFRRRVESQLAGRVAEPLPMAASPDERPTPSRYY